MSSGDNTLLTGNPCPPACCQRVCAAHPPEISNSEPVVSSLSNQKIRRECRESRNNKPLLTRYPTTGAIKSGCKVISLFRPEAFKYLTLNASTISCGLETNEGHPVTLRNGSTYQMVCVIAVPAEGAITLARILYFFPSIAMARVNPIIADLAVE